MTRMPRTRLTAANVGRKAFSHASSFLRLALLYG